VLYAFGSRAREALAHVDGRGTFVAGSASDLDLAALPEPGRIWSVDERVLMTAAFEDVFPAPRVDLIVLPQLGQTGDASVSMSTPPGARTI